MIVRGSELGFPPIYNAESRVLILGTYPSPKSFENGFYYMHPQNRFWKMLAGILRQPVPQTIPEKEKFLLSNHLALWDVLQTCTILGASDASITDPVPNDFAALLAKTDIHAIFCNGATAFKIYQKYCNSISLPVYKLPSTSPANASYSLTRLTETWQSITDFL